MVRVSRIHLHAVHISTVILIMQYHNMLLFCVIIFCTCTIYTYGKIVSLQYSTCIIATLVARWYMYSLSNSLSRCKSSSLKNVIVFFVNLKFLRYPYKIYF